VVLGGHQSVVSREVARHGGRESYRAVAAQERADRDRGRPKERVLVANNQLHEAVRNGLAERWSPRQVSRRLPEQFPGDQTLRVSHGPPATSRRTPCARPSPWSPETGVTAVTAVTAMRSATPAGAASRSLSRPCLRTSTPALIAHAEAITHCQHRDARGAGHRPVRHRRPGLRRPRALRGTAGRWAPPGRGDGGPSARAGGQGQVIEHLRVRRPAAGPGRSPPGAAGPRRSTVCPEPYQSRSSRVLTGPRPSRPTRAGHGTRICPPRARQSGQPDEAVSLVVGLLGLIRMVRARPGRSG